MMSILTHLLAGGVGVMIGVMWIVKWVYEHPEGTIHEKFRDSMKDIEF